MSESDLDLLPAPLREASRMEREIALPYPEVLEAIDALEAQDVFLLGWEPLATYPDGGFGSYPAPGIGGLDMGAIPSSSEWTAAVVHSAGVHRVTIEEEWRERKSTPPQEGVELIICLTVITRSEADAARG